MRVSHSVITFQLMRKGTLLQNDTLTCEGSFSSDDYRSRTGTSPVTLPLLDHSNSEPIGELVLDVQYVRKRDWLLDSLTKHLDAAAESFLVDAPVRSGLNPVRLSNNFRRFLVAITPVVHLQEAAIDVFQWKSPTASSLVALLLWITLSDLSKLPLILVLFFLFYLTCGYVRKASDPPPSDIDPDLLQNLIFIQESMGMGSDLADYLETWYKEVLCWGDPHRASACFELTLRMGLPVALLIWVVGGWVWVCGLPYFAAGSVMVAHPVVRALVTSSFGTGLSYYNSVTFRIWHSAYVPPLSPSRNKHKKDDSFDKRIFRVYENQRLWLGVWKYLLLPGERGVWSDINGKDLSKEQTPLPEGMEWTDIWHIDGDEEGWEYAIDFSKPFHKKKEFFDYVRRRCWVRTAETIKSKYE